MFETEFKKKDELYIQAVNGRKEMRQALRECRDKSNLDGS